jgi:hypothetical protein
MSSRIKSTVNAKQVAEFPAYPKVMRAKYVDLVVLFHAIGAGVVIGGSKKPVGEYRTDWNDDTFDTFHGSVTIEQE